MKNIMLRKKLATICLMLGMFLNPFGFDILVYKITQLTNSYWTTMCILYSLAVLSFLLSFVFFKMSNRLIGNFCLSFGVFLNPLGYDIIVYLIMLLIKDYWSTMYVMYGLASIFFLLFIYFSNFNFVKYIKMRHKKIVNKFKKYE